MDCVSVPSPIAIDNTDAMLLKHTNSIIQGWGQSTNTIINTELLSIIAGVLSVFVSLCV